MSGKIILVSGGNSGIGFALCKLLAVDRGCRVFLGSRSLERGQDAVERIQQVIQEKASDDSQSSMGQVECVQLDISSDASVNAAVETIKSKTNGSPLYALVNNAGTGTPHGVGSDVIMDTNLYGTKRVCEAFMDLLNPTEGRIVNVGSGAGPMYANKCDVETQRKLCDPMVEWAWIEEHAKTGLASGNDPWSGYGVSKALLACYTAILAREHPSITSSCITPGFIDTPLTKAYGGGKTPEEGTVAIMHCLFEKLEGNGWYYGSDGVRSPLHFLRNPGETAYDGKLP